LANVVLFDLDGTLIDSVELIVSSFRHTMRVHAKEELTAAEYRRTLGTPLRTQFASSARDEAELDAMIATYREFNLTHHDEYVEAYPGVVGAVEALHAAGCRMGIVTSKVRDTAQRGLEVAGFPDVFELVIGADDCEQHKPHPEPVQRALERMDVPANGSVYVGDSPFDMQSGRAAGVLTAAILWGPFEREALHHTEPNLWLTQPAELARLIHA